MKPSHSLNTHDTDAGPAHDVAFCLNCDDMDDLATSEEAHNLAQLRQRFHHCKEQGRFDGDLCARLFVAEDRIDDPTLFTDAEAFSPPGL